MTVDNYFVCEYELRLVGAQSRLLRVCSVGVALAGANRQFASFTVSVFLFGASSKKWERMGSCHNRQKTQAPTPQALIHNRQTKKVANAKGLNRNTNLT